MFTAEPDSNLTRVFSILCVQKEEEPEVVLVKMEEVESVTGTQNQTALSIQEGEWDTSTTGLLHTN